MGGGQDGLDDVFAAQLTRRASQGRLRRLTVPVAGVVDFSSNSYLSLGADTQLRRRYLARLATGADGVGGGASSRLLDGNSAAAEALEAAVAAFHGAPAGLLFNSGFGANTGLFGAAPQPGDVVVYDELIHASVHDGIRLGRAARGLAFAHNCVVDEARRGGRSLDAVLARLVDEDAAVRSGRANVFVAIESVYSMDGDVAPLRDVVDCVARRLPGGNGHVVVDEAHANGWLGPDGRGLVSLLGVEDRVWACVHTFGKALGCAGAIVLCSPTTRAYLINYARSLIYTTAMGHDALAGIQTAYEHLASGQAAPKQRRLRALMQHAHRLLAAVCARRRRLVRMSPAPPQSPIVPLFTPHARSLAGHCQQRGFMVRPIVAPTVRPGTDRVRVCLHVANTMDEVRGLCEAVDGWACAREAIERAVGAEDEDKEEDEHKQDQHRCRRHKSHHPSHGQGREGSKL